MRGLAAHMDGGHEERVSCPRCHGDGSETCRHPDGAYEADCSRCGGSGEVEDSGEPEGAGYDVFERQMSARYPERRS